MGLELITALVIAIVVGVWRLRRWRSTGPHEALQDVANAPPSAEPIAVTRWNEGGIGTYTHFLPNTPDQMTSDRRPND